MLPSSSFVRLAVAWSVTISCQAMAQVVQYDSPRLPEFAEMLKGEEQRKKAVQDAMALQQRTGQEQAIRAASDLATAKATAERIIADAASVRADIEKRNRELETSQSKLTKSNQELSVREKELKDNDRLLKTGIFGCAATCVVGIISCLVTTLSGRRDRNLTLLETVEKERALEKDGLDLSRLAGYTKVGRNTHPNGTKQAPLEKETDGTRLSRSEGQIASKSRDLDPPVPM